MNRLSRPINGRQIVAAVLYLCAWALTAAADQPQAGAREVVGVGLTVSDLERSIAFFTGVLDFTLVSTDEPDGDAFEELFGVFPVRIRLATLRLGSEEITLMEFLAPEGRPIPADSRSTDSWFQHVAIVVSDMDAAYARLREHRTRHISPGPQTLPQWNPNAGGIRAFYFKDPDGHALELIRFPQGKGDPRWQNARGQLFLGVDHTAIRVNDTQSALAFYHDLLGLNVAGKSENYGTEQERLNAVFGARLEITGLRAARGPGIEFLDYLAPGEGRPYPADSRASDVWHWHTTVAVPDVAVAFAALRHQRTQLVLPKIVPLPKALGGPRGFLVRDPDGHAVLIVGQ